MKELLERKFKKTGYNNGFTKLGFVLKDLSASQTAYFCITNSNEWLKNNFGLNVSLFYEEDSQPCVFPRFARFHLKDIFTFSGILIATDFNSVVNLEHIKNSKKFYYIQDLEHTRNNFKHSKEKFDQVMTDQNIIKFCRCSDHQNYFTSLNYKVSNTIVKDFNIDKIMEIINNENSRTKRPN
jgi:hypothetical protein